MAEMEAVLEWTSAMQFVGRAGQSPAVVLDDHEGNSGPSPMQLMLMGVAGCTAMDVVSILRKKRSAFTDLRVHIHGERAAQHPRIYTAIRMEFVVRGREVKDKDVQLAIELSITRYCSAVNSLKAPVSTSFRIEPPL